MPKPTLYSNDLRFYSTTISKREKGWDPFLEPLQI
jgi:hypothetical protein